jgi:hypothetical protein
MRRPHKIYYDVSSWGKPYYWWSNRDKKWVLLDEADWSQDLSSHARFYTLKKAVKAALMLDTLTTDVFVIRWTWHKGKRRVYELRVAKNSRSFPGVEGLKAQL